MRNPAIEAFRVLLMLMIVVWHAFIHGIYSESTDLWTLLFYIPLVWHVDGFIAISGWFGVKFSWKKFVRLWGIFVFYSILSWWYRPQFPSVSGGWFGGSYLMLMFMAPIINAGVESLASKGVKNAWIGWLVFASGMALSWLPLKQISGVVPAGGGALTLLTMIFVYVTSRLVRLTEDNVAWRNYAKWGIVVYFVFALVGGGVVSMIRHALHMPFKTSSWLVLVTYDSLPVVVMGVASLVLFSRIHIPDLPSKCLNFIAPSMFGVYLFHDTTSFGIELYKSVQLYLDGTSHAASVVFISALAVFVFGLLVDLLRRALVHTTFWTIDKLGVLTWIKH